MSFSMNKEEAVTKYFGLVKKVSRDYINRGLDYEELISEGTKGLLVAVERFDFGKGTCGFYSYALKWIKGSIKQALARLHSNPRVSLKEEVIAPSEIDLLPEKLKLEMALQFLDEKDKIVIYQSFGLSDGKKRKLKEIANNLGISIVAVWKRRKKAIARLKKILCSSVLPKKKDPSERLCRKEYMKRYRQKYGDKMRKQIKGWFEKHPYYLKEWRKKNPDYYKRWREKHLQERREYERNYQRKRRISISG